MDIGRGLQGEFPASGDLTVFNDSGNPLLSQVAIFARLLEVQQIERAQAANGDTQDHGYGANGGSQAFGEGANGD